MDSWLRLTSFTQLIEWVPETKTPAGLTMTIFWVSQTNIILWRFTLNEDGTINVKFIIGVRLLHLNAIQPTPTHSTKACAGRPLIHAGFLPREEPAHRRMIPKLAIIQITKFDVIGTLSAKFCARPKSLPLFNNELIMQKLTWDFWFVHRLLVISYCYVWSYFGFCIINIYLQVMKLYWLESVFSGHTVYAAHCSNSGQMCIIHTALLIYFSYICWVVL